MTASTPFWVWDDQVYYSARFTRQVTVHMLGGVLPVSGYIFGDDATHLGIVDITLQSHIIFKAHVGYVTVESRHDNPLLDLQTPEVAQSIKDVTAGFRHHVTKKRNVNG